MLIIGKPGRVIAINGSIPGPVMHMKEGQRAITRTRGIGKPYGIGKRLNERAWVVHVE